jgi:predicted RND superfamily exporter protein
VSRLDVFWEWALGGPAGLALRFPRRVLLGALLVAVASLSLIATRLELRTSNLDLVDRDLPEVARFLDFAHNFGTPNSLIVAFDGADPSVLALALDEAAAAIRPLPGVRSALSGVPFREEAVEALGVRPRFATDDGRMLFLVVQPADSESAVATIQPFVESVRRTLDRLHLERHGVHLGFTGLPQYALDDRDVVQHDIARYSSVSFVLILILFALGFRGLREPLLAMVVLTWSALLTAAAAALVPGHLTLVSAFVFSILFGLGIDFGVHVIDRAEELRADGLPAERALQEAIRRLAPGLGTGAATTAASFFLLMLSGFRGFAELGWLAGLGVVIALFAMVTLLPALLVLFPSRAAARTIGQRRLGRLLGRLQGRGMAAAWGALLAAAVATLIAVGPPAFDGNYLSLQPKGSPTVALERVLVERSPLSTQFAAFVVPNAEAARRLADRLRDEPLVSSVRTSADFARLVAIGAQLPDAWPSFRALFEAADGRLAVYAYPEGDVWDPAFQERFVERMRELDPQVTGMPFLGRFLVDLSRSALRRTALASALFLLLMVFLDLRRGGLAALSLLPTFGGIAMMAAGMRLLGWDWNPLNVLALPIVLGVAEDSGVHLAHRFVAERGDLARTLAGSGRTILICGATTLIGFGSLIGSSHRGLASFATALSLGVGAALGLSLFLLPWLLALWAGRRRPFDQPDEV